MSKKKHETPKSFYVSLLVSVLVFIVFLSYLPSMLSDEEEIDYGYNDYYDPSPKGDKELQTTKFNMITESILDDFVNFKIENEFSDYVVDLTLNNKLSNRENSVAQEVLNLYLSNKSSEAKKLVNDFVVRRLNAYDNRDEWRWRNHVLTLNNNGDEYILFNESNLLRSYEEGEAKGISSKNVSIYEFQVYYFTFPDGYTEIIKYNLFTGASIGGNISDFIDTGHGNKPKIDLWKIESDFVESDEIYTLEFKIWN